MINLLLGPPGGGKSYEAVAFHIIPALLDGRKVITNLPLNIDAILDAHPDIDPDLIEKREQTKAPRKEIDWNKAEALFKRFGIVSKEKPHNNYPFSSALDYSDSWRHPETGTGPFYVIDECHIALPRQGTPLDVEHWYSLHRHESADVLLITQSYGKINQAIRDLVQVCYRVKKATALGLDNRYIRKVYDGIRGECVNENIRVYDSTFFKFYKSHTLGGGAELKPADVRPIWQHWTFKGAAICFLLCFVILAVGNPGNPLKPKITANKSTTTPNQFQAVTTAAAAPASVTSQQTTATGAAEHVVKSKAFIPYQDLGVHIYGSIKGKNKEVWYLLLSQNGQPLKYLKSAEFEANGFRFRPVGECSAYLDHIETNTTRFITCDYPRTTINGRDNSTKSGASGGGAPAQRGGAPTPAAIASLPVPQS